MLAIFVLFVFLFIMACLAVAALAHLLFSIRNAVPPVPTPTAVMPQLLEALDLPERGTFYDLGSGDGRILKAVSAGRPKLHVVGVENNPMAIVLAFLRVGRRAKILRGDIMGVALEDANRVFAYLGPGLMASLEPKFERELPLGARVVSQQFPLPNRTPTRVIQLKRSKSHARRLYVYDY